MHLTSVKVGTGGNFPRLRGDAKLLAPPLFIGTLWSTREGELPVDTNDVFARWETLSPNFVPTAGPERRNESNDLLKRSESADVSALVYRGIPTLPD